MRRELAVSPESAGARPAGAGRRRQRIEGDGVQGPVQGHRGGGQDRHRAGPQRARPKGATSSRPTPGSSASRPRGGRGSRSPCWSSTAATAATWRRRSPSRSSTTTSRASRRPNAMPRVGRRSAAGPSKRAQPPARQAPPGEAAERAAAEAQPSEAQPSARRTRRRLPRRPPNERHPRRRLAEAPLPLRLDADHRPRWRWSRMGLVNLWSAVHERQSNLFAQQISWLGLGAAVFLAVATFDYRTIARLGYVLHGGRRRAADRRVRCSARRSAAGGAGSTWAVPLSAVGAGAAADHHRAREIPQRLARAGGAHLAPPGHPGRRSSACPRCSSPSSPTSAPRSCCC